MQTAIKVFAQPLGFVASVSGQSLVCNRSNASKKNKKTNAIVKNCLLTIEKEDATKYPYFVLVNGLSVFNLLIT